MVQSGPAVGGRVIDDGLTARGGPVVAPAYGLRGERDSGDYLDTDVFLGFVCRLPDGAALRGSERLGHGLWPSFCRGSRPACGPVDRLTTSLILRRLRNNKIGEVPYYGTFLEKIA